MTIRVIGFIALGTIIVAVPIMRTNQRVHGKKPRPLLELGAFAELPFLVYNIGNFFIFMGFLIPFVYIPVYAEVHLHTSTGAAFDLLAYANATSFVGRLLAAWMANKFGIMTLWTICVFASSITCLTWVAVSNIAGMVVFSTVYGFFSGALVGMPSAILPYFSPMNVLGTRMGMTWGLSGIALLVGSPIAGALVNLKSADFVRLQWLSGVLLFVGGCFELSLWGMIRKKLSQTATSNS